MACAVHAEIITEYETITASVAKSRQKRDSQSTTEAAPHVYTSAELQGKFGTPAPWAADEIDTGFPHACRIVEDVARR